MRIAAGILMIVFGAGTIAFTAVDLVDLGIHLYDLSFSLALIIPAVVITAGGVFCLKRGYWRLCFA